METNNLNIGGRLSYWLDDKNYFYFDGFYADEWLNSTRPDIYSLGRGTKPINIHAYRNNVILVHQGNYLFGETDTSIQYNSTQMTGRTFSDKDPTDRGLRGDDILANIKFVISISSNRLSLGAQYWFASMMDKIIPDNNFVYQHNAALFAEDEWAILDNLFLTLGVRQDYNSVFGFHISPRAYLVYNFTHYLTLKGGISTGYKTPNVNTLIKGSYGYSQSPGSSQQTYHYGNPNLKPETSYNFEFSILSQTDYTDIGVSGFYILFRDKITSSGSISNGNEFLNKVCDFDKCDYNINVDTANTYGVESYASIKPISIGFGDIGLNLNYTWTRSLVTSGKGKWLPFANVPEHNLNAQFRLYFFESRYFFAI